MQFLMFALIAALTHSVHSIANKFLVEKKGVGALAGIFLVQGATGIIALPAIAFTHAAWLPGVAGDLLIAVFIFLGGFMFMMLALALEDASAVGPILGLKVIFLALLESAVQGHSVGAGVWIGAVASLLGITLIGQTDRWSLHPRDLLRPGVGLMALSALCYAIFDVFVKGPIARWHGDSLAFTLYLVALTGAVSLLGLLVLSRVRPASPRARLLAELHWPSLRPAVAPMLISAAAILITQFCLFTSFAIGRQVTLSNILFNMRSLFVVVIMALLVLGAGSTVERAGWRAYAYRTSGAALTVGAVLLAIVLR